MNKNNNNNKSEDVKLPARFVIVILLLIIYVIYVYLIGWTKALLYFTYFLLFLLFFNISIKTNLSKEKLSKYNHNKCNDIKLLIEKLKKEYDSCICGKKLSSNICKTGLYQYDSDLLAKDNDKNYINLDKFDNTYKLIDQKFPYSK